MCTCTETDVTCCSRCTRGALFQWLWHQGLPETNAARCPRCTQGALFYWSWQYYASKYYELLDTVLLALKAKPLSFLHVFHHATVMPMAYLWVDHSQSLQQVRWPRVHGLHLSCLQTSFYPLSCQHISS